MKVLGGRIPAWPGYCALAYTLTIAVGCSGVGGNKEFLNFALYEYGADVTSSGQNGERTANSLINGVKDSAAWEGGEGWEYTFTRTETRERGGQRTGGVENRIAQGSAWALVKFAEPVVINRVVVTALHTEETPFPGYKGAELQAYDARDSFSPWKTVARIDQGKVVVPGRQSAPSGPTTVFRFNPVEAEQIRFMIWSMQDSKSLQPEANYQQEQAATRDQPRRDNYYRITRGQETTVRLLEIEATGTEAIKMAQARKPTAAESILLQDLTGAAPAAAETP
ncbi:hypothetical protein CMK11_04980 [Candidatus Poribacteria bacterium]|nr:hypothetical protein [Candidatus Poribacteria bacterium]